MIWAEMLLPESNTHSIPQGTLLRPLNAKDDGPLIGRSFLMRCCWQPHHHGTQVMLLWQRHVPGFPVEPHKCIGPVRPGRGKQGKFSHHVINGGNIWPDKG